MISLRGKIALITGGSRGIGLAIAKKFAAQGASTVLVARDPERLRAAVTAVQAAYVPTPPSSPSSQASSSSSAETSKQDEDSDLPFYTGVAGDVAQASTWHDLIGKLMKGNIGCRPRGQPFGPEFLPDRIDVLVNCAGIAQYESHFMAEPQNITKILDTNLLSAALGCKYVGRNMRGAPRGTRSIINVSSAMALGGGSGAAVYAASKAGLLGLTSALASEFARNGIRVNALLPGYIETEMTAMLSSHSLCQAIPMRRFGTVEEVAEAAAFLAQNAYANNCILTIDGGLSAGIGTGASKSATVGQQSKDPQMSDD